MSKRILITGGGTAGHVFPALAVVEALLRKEADGEILFVGGRNGVEEELTAKAGVLFRGISVGKLRRYPDVRNLIDPFRVGAGYFESLAIMASFRPDVIFAKGGYVTVPVVLAGKSRRIPIIAHESDFIMGISNRLSNRLATKICTAFPVEFYPPDISFKLIFTGNPIRLEFFHVKNRKFHSSFGLSPTLPTVLVMGGSQGAMGLNELVAGQVKDLTRKAQLIHLTGSPDFERMNEIKRKLPPSQAGRYVIFPFLSDVAKAQATADLVVSRAGANALFELAFLGKPTILIPLPNSANNHQLKNAQYFAQKGAVKFFEQGKITSPALGKEITRLISERLERAKLSHAIESLAQPDAAEKVAQVILETA